MYDRFTQECEMICDCKKLGENFISLDPLPFIAGNGNALVDSFR